MKKMTIVQKLLLSCQLYIPKLGKAKDYSLEELVKCILQDLCQNSQRNSAYNNYIEWKVK